MTETVPDYVVEGPIFLYRIMGIQDSRTMAEMTSDDSVTPYYRCDLVSPQRQTPWPKGEISAFCGRSNDLHELIFLYTKHFGTREEAVRKALEEDTHHVAPASGCQCGLYGFFSINEAFRANGNTLFQAFSRMMFSENAPMHQINTIAAIQVWGKYVKHRRGLRVQHAKVLGLVGGEFHKSLLKEEYSHIDWYESPIHISEEVRHGHRYGKAGGRFDSEPFQGYPPRDDFSGFHSHLVAGPGITGSNPSVTRYCNKCQEPSGSAYVCMKCSIIRGSVA